MYKAGNAGAVYQWGGGSLHGKCETVCEAVRAMRCAGYRDVRGKLYPGMRHEILNEKDKEKVYHDIFTYICKKGL